MLPTFLVIGAMKAGTTSLHAYLASSPDVFMSEPKELDFFVSEKAWSKGLAWYEGHFARARPDQARGEASTSYTKHPTFSGVPERIRSTIPEVRLVYVVRHPVERMVSHWQHNRAAGLAAAPLVETLSTEPHYLDCSRYSMQIDRYLEHFTAEQLLVVTAEDLRHDRAATVAHVLAFVGAGASDLPQNLDAELHRTADASGRRGRLRRSRRREGILPAAVEEELVDRLRPDVGGLRRFLPPEWDGWGIA